MNFVHITAWCREKVRDESAYYSWLNSVKDGDLIVQQEFVPNKGKVLELGIECWQFTLVRIHGNEVWDRLTLWDSSPINREKGWLCWRGSKDEWGEVFPARLVPLSSELGYYLKKVGDRVISNKPIYEPLYLDNLRFVYLVERGPEYFKRINKVQQVYPRSYYRDCEEGALFNCFAPSEQEIEENRIKFLYSEYLER